MLVIAENINVMTTTIGNAMKERQKEPIQELARKCVEAGADVLDINLGPARKDGDKMMEFVVETVAEVAPNVQQCLDTTNHVAMEAGIVKCEELGLPKPIINSFSAQPDKMENILPLAAKYDCEIIGLTMGQAIPIDANERVSLAYELVVAANELGIPNEKIFIDPIILPVGVDVGQQHAVAVMEVLQMLQEMFEPKVQTTCGLSNISNGAPDELRPAINAVYLSMLAAVGMTSAIVDALDKEMMRTVRLIRALQNNSLYSVSDAELR
ncbi:MAG: methyltetrahydrofolate cobalamin methyltransferase [Thermoleophilia bacterium]